MEKFTNLTSRVMPLALNDVDTDLIIPAQYLTSVSRDGYGQNVFRRLKDGNPTFPMNLPEYKDSQILLSARNFGCGSSREAAVWALQGAGIRVVIAESFADIFASNSAKSGLLLVALEPNVVDQLLQACNSGALTLSIDLAQQCVSDGTSKWTFEYDAFRKHCLLNGLDDLDYILSNNAEVAKHRDQATVFLRS